MTHNGNHAKVETSTRIGDLVDDLPRFARLGGRNGREGEDDRACAQQLGIHVREASRTNE